ncbi:formate--tetrahydrofolate ligase [Ethanoligenens harbinense]|uniref:Formate--tetrahydrofolate ligase n=1 Tax=Ethanoligenens harbinense (strain DSM 18485 / JCM 12961 / CGMCC 1.5033 / YUAN-3) TaxID=663278 RepID=E6U974_ETHHY|nr:formate--tetrahydrofolate ligase [Ethanoligenens harbinense]ADU27233.1 Formate--tetrahydrofolate ligase [Ethanoligenens harbinense YUAN-3]AVQ96301.1 formate--tetrahydrofolate ligase [Ethanoligenens harbinense YUAN-3]AYF38960.1 formate--tetrahydrofolate ligase [Ethanoligenens harbinense]AYF41712.1 formate--tetrahydrofolate ligase [Ethanoligenens harbinense]QCN92542.1 formate--tetrahydrofolate ligase [Ethanoligenens harbinense]
MQSDIEIAHQAVLQPIAAIAARLGVSEDELDLYGKYKAKLNDSLFRRLADKTDGKLILVTAINPTPAGEGKTTTTVGLGDALRRLGKQAVIALREPSLGPVFGMKGGAAGGGYAQVMPMEDINLHFTGDMHAITAANNLLCAILDNHLQQGNALGIDPRRILFKRVLDMNDRVLRQTVVGLGGKGNGIPREDGFVITVASEVMAILCLARNIADLKKRLGTILVAYSYAGEPVYCRQLGVAGAMAALLKDALNPNLVQTLEGTAAIIHGGPFANIAHGCNSVRATSLALKLGDYCVTEAGFGSDLGAEKFMDIKCRAAGLHPAAVVLVATIRALKYNGGVKRDALGNEDVGALRRGADNLRAHIANMRRFGVPVVVAINRFGTDTEAELSAVEGICREEHASFALSEVFTKGGEGGLDLAKKVIEAADTPSSFLPLYDLGLSLKEKIDTLAQKLYGAGEVQYTPAAEKALAEIAALGGNKLPICVAKTQYSLSDDASALGRPKGFTLHVRDARLSAGAGFVVIYTGNILQMPGLPKKPAAELIDIDENGTITGLF